MCEALAWILCAIGLIGVAAWLGIRHWWRDQVRSVMAADSEGQGPERDSASHR